MSREPQKSAAAKEWARTFATATLPELGKIEAELKYNLERRLLPPVPKCLQRGANRAKGDGLNACFRALDDYIDEGTPHFDLRTRIFAHQQEQRGRPSDAAPLAVAIVFLAHTLLLDGWGSPEDDVARTADFLAVDKQTVRWALRVTELHERRLSIAHRELHDGFMQAHHALLDVLIGGKLGLAIAPRRRDPHEHLDGWFLS